MLMCQLAARTENAAGQLAHWHMLSRYYFITLSPYLFL